MVDLVKIRKKKNKEKAEEAEATRSEASPSAAQPQASGAQTAAGEPPAPRDETAAPRSAPADEATTGKAPRESEPAGPSGEPTKLDRFMEQAGKRREAQSIQQEEQAAAAQLELLTFVIAGEHYAVDIERIVEIVTPRAVTRIPNADPSVVGIMSLRGTIVTLVDVRSKLRHRSAAAVTEDTRVVVIDFRNEIIGFTVDRVLRVVKAAPGDIEPHPVVHATELDDSIRGVFRTGGALTILLDLDKLLDHKSLAARTA